MKQQITREQIKKLDDMNNKLKGTPAYQHLLMQHETRLPNGRWVFVGYNVPHYYENETLIRHYYLKTIKNITYLMVNVGCDIDDRFLLTSEAKEVLFN